MLDTETILTPEQLAKIEALSTKVPDGPWFASADDADDVPDHRRSGLALVDTGRSADWWIARLCEWHTARFIAESKTNIDALCRSLRAAWATIQELKSRTSYDWANIIETLQSEVDRLRTQNQTQAESIIEFQANEKSLKAQLAEAAETLKAQQDRNSIRIDGTL